MYRRQATGLSPEHVVLSQGVDFRTGVASYLLRPETIETLFYLWRLTNNTMYQEWGWEIFQAVEKYCKTSSGYCGIKNVAVTNPPQDDVQQSWFLAETLKYFYLLFCPHDVIPLDKFIFNTEAHPLSIFTDPNF